jgi:hypothetical protein
MDGAMRLMREGIEVTEADERQAVQVFRSGGLTICCLKMRIGDTVNVLRSGMLGERVPVTITPELLQKYPVPLFLARKAPPRITTGSKLPTSTETSSSTFCRTHTSPARWRSR